MTRNLFLRGSKIRGYPEIITKPPPFLSGRKWPVVVLEVRYVDLQGKLEQTFISGHSRKGSFSKYLIKVGTGMGIEGIMILII